jgi:hypothetical protein
VRIEIAPPEEILMAQAFDLDEPYAPRVIMNPDPDRVLASAVRPEPMRPTVWSDLLMHDAPGTRDRRGAAAVLVKLGLFPLVLHGLTGDRCTCGRYPCGTNNRNAGKHPVLAAWQKLPLDLAELDRMFETNWRFNLGARTGRQPNGRFLVVVDVDGPRSLLEPLERENGAFPPTLTAQTGRGGLHLFYWVRPGVEITNQQGIVPHVDIRGTGGQVVVSPSRHYSGNHYSWLDAREPELLP